MSAKSLSILNSLSVGLVLVVNYVSVAFPVNGNTVGSLSAEYENLFTPAGFAFSIWGLIFIGLILYSVNEITETFKLKDEFEFTKKAGIWFSMANILNALWVFVWLYEITWLSVIIMIGLLLSLIKVVLNTDMERWDAPLRHIAFRWWPICFYSGWIAVATIANISAYLAKLGWNGYPLSEETWTIIMIIVATVLNLFMIKTRNMREFALVGAWALFAIYVRHIDSQQTIALVSLASSILLVIVIAYHSIINRDTSPFVKIFQNRT